MIEACSNFSNLLVDFADGECSPDDHRRVAEHIANCAACSGELRQLERSLDLARAEWRRAAQPMLHPARPLRWTGIAARTAACIACFLIAAAALLPRAKQAAPPPQVAVHSKPAAEESMADAEINDYISRRERAARLAESVKLLASQPGLESYAERAQKYMATVVENAPVQQ